MRDLQKVSPILFYFSDFVCCLFVYLYLYLLVLLFCFFLRMETLKQGRDCGTFPHCSYNNMLHVLHAPWHASLTDALSRGCGVTYFCCTLFWPQSSGSCCKLIWFCALSCKPTTNFYTLFGARYHHRIGMKSFMESCF